jgi:hypothetical protein
VDDNGAKEAGTGCGALAHALQSPPRQFLLVSRVVLFAHLHACDEASLDVRLDVGKEGVAAPV